VRRRRRGPVTPVSDAERERIIYLRETRRKSVRFIRHDTGRSHGAICYVLLRAGIDPFECRTRHHNVNGAFSPEEDARIEALQLEKKNATEIARLLKRARSSIIMRIMLLAVRAEKALQAAA
jgi:hypothetical protein